jgi:hypothetical protein
MDTIHFGLNVAQLNELEKYKDKSNLDIMISWARNMIEVWEVKRGDENFKVLETAPHFFEVTSVDEIQEYQRFLIGACLST